ncbi:DNA repair and transcription factor Ada [Cordyceps javanica]|uniref:DNA repair and transcription factor Ada n=1 Tax=Cordyceps javanica TaxID=43265 RepID=A0A545V408_9HYPO|nr:DNA repair and transcription factor Ada [Cordyceps javanica]TQW07723.1 DNA repair and transcription factor Ada [Cordyceps javanica]
MDVKQDTPSSEPSAALFRDDARRWQAVQDRDGAADGLFVYAVKTTKIFCRPICKARLARRANVSFYDTGREAHEAGFRACKRCKPELAGGMPEELAVRKIRAFVEEQQRQRRRRRPAAADRRGTPRVSTGNSSAADTRLSLSQMARQTGLSKWHFHRVFKRCVGTTPTEFLRGDELAAAAASSTSVSPPTSGTLSPWTDSDLDSALGWPAPTEDVGGFHDIDFALFDVESAALMPFGGSGLAWDDANLSFDDFLLWPEDPCKIG